MGVNRMTGTPWHTEALRIGEDDSRRHKSRCIYYNRNTNRCSKMVDKCIGSARCENYEEDPVQLKARAEKQLISEMLPKHKAQMAQQKSEPEPVQPVIDYCAYYPIGCRVIHETLGKGVIQDHDKGKLTIVLLDGSIKRLDPRACYEREKLIVIS